MKNIAIYPGTFDPLTNGHLDIIKRAAAMFDKVIVAVLINKNKTPVFSEEQRLKQIKTSIASIKNAEADSFDGLLADYMEKNRSRVIIRGLRAVTDLEYEFQLANTNHELNEKLETIFLMPSSKYAYLTSSMVREIYSLGGRLSAFVPPAIEKDLIKLYSKKQKAVK